MPPCKAAPASIPAIKLPSPVKTIEKPKRKLPDSFTKKAVPVEPEVTLDPVDEAEYLEELELDIERAQAYCDWANEIWRNTQPLDKNKPKKASKDCADPDDIVNFVWKHVPDEDKSEFRCKAQLKRYIAQKPSNFLDLLESALCEAEVKAGPGRAIAYNGAMNFSIWLEEWLDENLKTKEQRLDEGEIVTGSDEEGPFENFFISDGEEACGTSSDKIFDFIWKYIGKEEQKKFKTRDQLEYVLSCEPMDLLKYLQSALDAASWHIGPLIP